MLCGHFILINLINFSWASNYFLDISNSDYWADKFDVKQNCAQQRKVEKLRHQVESKLPQCAIESVGFSSHFYHFRSQSDRSNLFIQRSMLKMKVMKVEKRERLICAS